jgi:hypothetical protein
LSLAKVSWLRTFFVYPPKGDNGTCGNYWSYNSGIVTYGDGISDTSYPVSNDDVDTYPPMFPIAFPITESNDFLGTNMPLESGLTLIVGAIITISVTLYIVVKPKN